MKKLIFALAFLILFTSLLHLAIAVPPPPPSPAPPADGSEQNTTQPSENCSDNIKNQDESDTDCGGKCGKCGNNKQCLTDSDCRSSYCSPLKKCSTPSCGDSWRNGNEEDIDCGGNCPPCIVPEAPKNNNSQSRDSAGNGQNVPLPPERNASNISSHNFLTEDNPNDLEAQPAAQETNKKTGNQPETEYIKVDRNGYSNILLGASLAFNFVLLLALGALIAVYPRKKNENMAPNAPRIGHDLRLKNYVETGLRKGYSPKDIRRRLLESNWREEEISWALNEARKW